jgi:hypothetical protein
VSEGEGRENHQKKKKKKKKTLYSVLWNQGTGREE